MGFWVVSCRNAIAASIRLAHSTPTKRYYAMEYYEEERWVSKESCAAIRGTMEGTTPYLTASRKSKLKN